MYEKTSRVGELIRGRQANPFKPGIKVNLYRGYEYRAMARAVAEFSHSPVESVMVGDSYFMTHLGGDTTVLDEGKARFALRELPRLIAEVRAEIDKNEFQIAKPLLMADIPDGLDADQTIRIVEDYKRAGADMIKVELASDDDVWIVKAISDLGLIAAVHLGYQPQKNENRTYGVTAEEIARLAESARRVASYGCECIIFERVSEVANQILTKLCLEINVLPYSIFSGRAPRGGQSLNVWDSAVIADKPSIFFPPTAVITREQVSARYDQALITECFGKLLRLAVANVFPPSPRNAIEVSAYVGIVNQFLMQRQAIGVAL